MDLPDKNNLIPTDFEILKNNNDDSTHPKLIESN
jgi:hypothetical protein